MEDERSHRKPRGHCSAHSPHHQTHHSKLRDAFKLHEQQWRLALEDDQHDELTSSNWRHRCRGPLIACAIVATVSALLLGPGSSVGRHIHYEISHVIAQFVTPQNKHEPSALTSNYQPEQSEPAS